jgi:hypothetical protein
MISVFLLSACGNPSIKNTNTEPQKENSTTTTAVSEAQKSPLSMEEQLKNSLLAEYYAREVVSIKGDELHFAFVFNLANDGGRVPDSYGSNVNFSFKVGEKLVFPESIEFVEKGFSEDPRIRMGRYEGTFKLVETNEEHLIYNSSKPQRTLVLFKAGEGPMELAYYFNGEENPMINENNVEEVIANAYEEGEMVIQHSRSADLYLEAE